MDKTKREKLKNQKGITLIALVITIVILIILSVVTINMAFGDNGLVKYAEEARDKTANSTIAEAEGINSMVDQFANVMAEDSEVSLPDIYVDGVLPTAPKLSEGMTPVKYEEGTGWVKTNEYDRWYDYANKEWANVVLGDATFIASGDKEILDEEKAYSMLVWIPRYAYQITSGYHQSGAEINPSDGTKGAGNINIVFIDTANKNKEGTTTYSEEYPNYATGSGMEDYVVHPAFNYGGTALSGFWVGKYETSHTASTTGVSTEETDTNVTTLTPMIKAGVISWIDIQVSNIFTVCTSMNDEDNPYGLNASDNIVDPHMMKNSEWGAVAYLSQNAIYGKGSEVSINNGGYITGGENYKSNTAQSTTGNITGIYDMNGGAHEYLAAYVNNSYVNNYGNTLVSAANKYKDVYSVGNSDRYDYNYAVATIENGHYGDAVWETTNKGNASASAWYSDYSYFPNTTAPFFLRGGGSSGNEEAGVFSFSKGDGARYSHGSFRVVMPIY